MRPVEASEDSRHVHGGAPLPAEWSPLSDAKLLDQALHNAEPERCEPCGMRLLTEVAKSWVASSFPSSKFQERGSKMCCLFSCTEIYGRLGCHG